MCHAVVQYVVLKCRRGANAKRVSLESPTRSVPFATFRALKRDARISLEKELAEGRTRRTTLRVTVVFERWHFVRTNKLVFVTILIERLNNL